MFYARHCRARGPGSAGISRAGFFAFINRAAPSRMRESFGTGASWRCGRLPDPESWAVPKSGGSYWFPSWRAVLVVSTMRCGCIRVWEKPQRRQRRAVFEKFCGLVADGRTRGRTSSPVVEPASSGVQRRPVARPASQKGRVMGTGRPRRERSDAAAQHRTCRRTSVGGESPRCRRLLARANPLLPRRCAGATHHFAESGGRTPLKPTRRDSEPGVCPT